MNFLLHTKSLICHYHLNCQCSIIKISCFLWVSTATRMTNVHKSIGRIFWHRFYSLIQEVSQNNQNSLKILMGPLPAVPWMGANIAWSKLTRFQRKGNIFLKLWTFWSFPLLLRVQFYCRCPISLLFVFSWVSVHLARSQHLTRFCF